MNREYKIRFSVAALIVLIGAVIGTNASFNLGCYAAILFYVVTEKRHKIF